MPLRSQAGMLLAAQAGSLCCGPLKIRLPTGIQVEGVREIGEERVGIPSLGAGTGLGGEFQ